MADTNKQKKTPATGGRRPAAKGQGTVTATAASKAPAKSKTGTATVRSAAKKPAKSKDDGQQTAKVKRRSTFSEQFLPYIFGALALMFAVFLILNVLDGADAPKTHAGGVIGYYVCRILFGCLGWSAYLLPLCFLYLAIFWRRYCEERLVAVKVILSVLLMVLISAVIHVGVCASNTDLSQVYDVGHLFRTGAVFESGGVIGGLAGYALATKEKPDLKQSRLSAIHANEVPLGSKAELQLEVTLPVNLPPPVCSVEAPSGTVAGKVKIRHGRYLWKHNLWILQCPLYAVKPGAATGGKITVTVKGNFPAEEKFAIPDFVIAPVHNAGEHLELAGKLEETAPPLSKQNIGIIVTVGILLALLGFWLWQRWRNSRENTQNIVPPWVHAELALDRLSMELESKNIQLGTAFFRLTDIVRKYLEDRYHLPVTSRTTDEFIQDIRENSPLPETDQPFLRDFLTSADLIKFARMKPDEAGIRHAITGARELVKHTKPVIQEGEGKHV